VIPEAAITHWRNMAPWPQDAQVEQDLILCRALIEIFQDPVLSRSSLLRGGTAFRALYQRRKGRDLFDLWVALGMQEIDLERIVLAFRRYMDAEGSHVSQTEFRKNLAEKVAVPSFSEDLRPLLAPRIHYDVTEAAALVADRLLALL
jgi:predicted nucleotidyltransferase component of viral defense system